MTRRTACHFAGLLLAAVAGCYTGPTDLSPAVTGPGGATPGTIPAPDDLDAAGDEHADAPQTATGLPCDVARVLATACTTCHSGKPVRGAPNPLVTYDDLVAEDALTGKSFAETSLARMKDSKRPMPPSGSLSASDLAAFEAWVEAGTPRGTCGGPAAASDGGPPSAADAGASTSSDASTTPATSVCTSGQTWTGGAPGPLMQPGKPCLGCHAATGARVFQLAGTVYPTLHEPDGCFGAAKPGVKVVIVDGDGVSHSMSVNANGNFYRITSLPLPYTAMVVDGTTTRVMHAPQTNGDCNSCHTGTGAGSPGRIMLP
ncbi:MAG: hypothetical protein JWP97_6594 [Labilithrix sp.]|nr:hypothetical protein [Labilithrix sp.]